MDSEEQLTKPRGSNLCPRFLNIQGKEIWVVDDHQYVLLIWAKRFLTTKQAPVLVSIDYHPDTNPSFWLYAYQKAVAIDPSRETELVEKFQKKIMASINPGEPESILSKMVFMRNDEHINTALAFGFLSDYHMINCMEKHEYDRGIHYLVEENDYGSLRDEMFESIKLPINSLLNEVLILDIDLDYFMRRKDFELNLQTNRFFSDLVRQAEIITVARSAAYFDYLKKEDLTIEECEARLIGLLEKIL
jgi:hypothetical protein